MNKAGLLPHLAAAACFGAGHLVRDGWPDLNTLTGGDPATGKRGWLGTQAARFFGGALCGLGALAVFGGTWLALALYLAVWLGFYADMRHAAGQSAQTWRDAEYLDISGEASVFLAALVLFAWGHLLLSIALFGVGFMKAGIWFGCYRWCSQAPGAWLKPTRVAAIIFGALFGLVV